MPTPDARALAFLGLLFFNRLRKVQCLGIPLIRVDKPPYPDPAQLG